MEGEIVGRRRTAEAVYAVPNEQLRGQQFRRMVTVVAKVDGEGRRKEDGRGMLSQQTTVTTARAGIHKWKLLKPRLRNAPKPKSEGLECGGSGEEAPANQ